MDKMDWKWMEWMGKGEEFGEAEVGKKGKGFGEDLEYVGRYGFTNTSPKKGPQNNGRSTSFLP